jgi:hypothetical protein
MRVRFKAGVAIPVEGRMLILGNEEADVEPAPDGRYALIVPRGELAGQELYVDEDTFDILG